MTKYKDCEKCGEKNLIQRTYCYNCYQSFQPKPIAPPINNVRPSYNLNKHKRRLVIIWWLCSFSVFSLMLLWILLGIGFFLTLAVLGGFVSILSVIWVGYKIRCPKCSVSLISLIFKITIKYICF